MKLTTIRKFITSDGAVYAAILLGSCIGLAVSVHLLVSALTRMQDNEQERFSGFRSAHTYQAGR